MAQNLSYYYTVFVTNIQDGSSKLLSHLFKKKVKFMYKTTSIFPRDMFLRS